MLKDRDISVIRDQITSFAEAGLPPEVVRFLKDLADTIGELRHDYNICHNDAVANAQYASALERRIDELTRGKMPTKTYSESVLRRAATIISAISEGPDTIIYEAIPSDFPEFEDVFEVVVRAMSEYADAISIEELGAAQPDPVAIRVFLRALDREDGQSIDALRDAVWVARGFATRL